MVITHRLVRAFIAARTAAAAAGLLAISALHASASITDLCDTDIDPALRSTVCCYDKTRQTCADSTDRRECGCIAIGGVASEGEIATGGPASGTLAATSRTGSPSSAALASAGSGGGSTGASDATGDSDTIAADPIGTTVVNPVSIQPRLPAPVSPVPLPSSMPLFGGALIALAAARAMRDPIFAIVRQGTRWWARQGSNL